MRTVYFQPPGINSEYCEAGTIHDFDKDYIYYIDEPCKIEISSVKLIPKNKVIYDRKKKLHYVKK